MLTLRFYVAVVVKSARSFGKNQGVLLAGAIAYYALLSVLPLLILAVIGLSHFVDQAMLLNTLAHYLEWLVPSQSKAVLTDISTFLQNRISIGAGLLLTMIFFSSLAFSVLQKAMAVVFAHRMVTEKRHFVTSAVLPYCFVCLACIAMLGLTGVSIALETLARQNIHLFGGDWSLRGRSGLLLYILGLFAETVILATMYLVMPVGRIRWRHALIGGFTATALWEIIRHVLIWYFTTLSNASVVYGSLTTAVVVLFSLEIAATLFLFGAQVISECERIAKGDGV